MLKEGDKSPDFSLKDAEGKVHKLSDYKGKVVLYFYPKDDTPGCTKEACNFRDNFSEIKKKAVILGVSPDSQESHKKFQKKYTLPFTLLADTEKEVVNKYGVWKEKIFMGKKYMGIERTTFILNNGKIEKIFPKVKPDEHVKEVLESL